MKTGLPSPQPRDLNTFRLFKKRRKSSCRSCRCCQFFPLRKTTGRLRLASFIMRMRKLTSICSAPLPQPVFAIAEAPSKFVPSTIREKAKTRRSQVTSFDDTSPSETEAASSQSSPRSSISVKPENLTLFDAMFPLSTQSKEQTRSFSWKHFLQAMTDAGCSITHRNGSAVSFKNDQGVILFHQPTIDPIVLTSMGKRLRKWFGWSRDVFAPKLVGEIASGE